MPSQAIVSTTIGMQDQIVIRLNHALPSIRTIIRDIYTGCYVHINLKINSNKAKCEPRLLRHNAPLHNLLAVSTFIQHYEPKIIEIQPLSLTRKCSTREIEKLKQDQKSKTCCLGGSTPKATPIANWELDSWHHQFTLNKLFRQASPTEGLSPGDISSIKSRLPGDTEVDCL